jgi:membrane associated rhomboid family serine protease
LARPSERIFNVPAAVLWIIVVLVLIQAGRQWLLTDDENFDFLLYFAFIPARYNTSLLGTESLPGGLGAEIWTFLTYAFLHADFIHVGVNSMWFLPFGSAMARRFGAWRFLGFFAVTAIAGAALHLLTRPRELLPMIGASAAVSGLMAGSVRFIFQIGGPVDMFRTNDEAAYRVPAAPLLVALRDPRIIIFLMAWFGLNLLFGVGVSSLPGMEQSVAWQAHIGGFLAGLILFALFSWGRKNCNCSTAWCPMLARSAFSRTRLFWLPHPASQTWRRRHVRWACSSLL